MRSTPLVMARLFEVASEAVSYLQGSGDRVNAFSNRREEVDHPPEQSDAAPSVSQSAAEATDVTELPVSGVVRVDRDELDRLRRPPDERREDLDAFVADLDAASFEFEQPPSPLALDLLSEHGIADENATHLTHPYAAHAAAAMPSERAVASVLAYGGTQDPAPPESPRAALPTDGAMYEAFVAFLRSEELIPAVRSASHDPQPEFDTAAPPIEASAPLAVESGGAPFEPTADLDASEITAATANPLRTSTEARALVPPNAAVDASSEMLASPRPESPTTAQASELALPTAKVVDVPSDSSASLPAGARSSGAPAAPVGAPAASLPLFPVPADASKARSGLFGLPVDSSSAVPSAPFSSASADLSLPPFGSSAVREVTTVPNDAPDTSFAQVPPANDDAIIIYVEPARREDELGSGFSIVANSALTEPFLQGATSTSPARRPAPGRFALAVTVALAAIALIDTRAFELQLNALSHTLTATDYARIRHTAAFAGIDVEKVALELDKRMPPEKPIALSAKLNADALLFQRLREGLYPRPIELEARHTLELDRGATRLDGRVHLDGLKLPSYRTPAAQQTLEFDVGRASTLVLSFFGYALMLLLGARRLPRLREYICALPLGIQVPAALLATSGALGTLPVVATLFGRGLNWTAVAYGGLLALALTTLLGLPSRLRTGPAVFAQRLARFARACVRPEILLGCAVLGLALRFVYMTPITLWDARSVWFFLAKQLSIQGRLLPEEVIRYPWVHSEYPPLLYPGTAAFFSSLGGWNERHASIALFVLFATTLTLVFALARHALGRWAGTAFVAIAWAYLFANLVSGYADGFVTLGLLIGLLGFYRRTTEPIGWLGVWCAALIKREGLILGLVAAALHTAVGRPSRGRHWLLRIAPFLGFLPAALHIAWLKHVGVLADFANARMPAQSAEIWTRMDAIWDALRNQTLTRGPASVGIAGLALALVFLPNWRRRRGGAVALGTGLAGLILIGCAFLVTPFNVGWHLQVALDRLVTQIALLLVTAGILLAAVEDHVAQRASAAQAAPVPPDATRPLPQPTA